MLIFSDRFKKEFASIIDFISDDSVERALKFKDDFNLAIKKIKSYQLAYRKSILFDDESVRDFIFKKYVIPFWIVDDDILVLGYLNQTFGSLN